MKKSLDVRGLNGYVKKLLFVMKLTIVAFFLGLLSLSASTYSQTKKISLDLHDSSILDVFSQIESQSEFVFIYKNEALDLNQKVNLKVENATVDKVLKAILQNSGANYQIVDKQIIITPDRTIAPTLNNEIIEISFTPPQKKEISGVVKDNKGNYLPGTSIALKGTTIGTITDAEGKFHLSIPADAKTLIFTFVGMKSQEIAIGNNTTFNIVLQEETVGVDEVVVTALGIEKNKKTLTYATQQVNMDKLTTIKDVSLGNSLAGKVAGVSIVASTGTTGVSGDPRIVIRGNKSVTRNNQPLIIIDGIQISQDGGGLTGINPDDVQSMNVLKGSAASAIYGSAAENGAIIVTTKKGKSGEPRIEVNSVSNFDLPYLYPEIQNEYGQGTGGNFDPLSYVSSWGPKMTGQTVTDWTGKQVALTPQKNNVKDIFNVGYNFTNSFSYSAGNDKSTSYFSYSNTSAQGLLKDNKITRHNFNLRLSTELIKNLKLDFKITYLYSHLKDKPTNGDDLFSPMFQAIKMPRSIRTADIKAASFYDSSFALKQLTWTRTADNTTSTAVVNPYWAMAGYENPSTSNNIKTYLTLKYDFTSWLYLQLRGAFNTSSSDEEKKTYWDTQYVNSALGNYYTNFSKGKSVLGDFLLVFNKKLTKDFRANVNLGGELTDSYGRSQKADSGGLTAENKFALAYAKSLTSSDGESHTQRQSLYGMGQLSFRDYLFLDVTERKEWNSTLPNPYSYSYPSVGLTGVVSDMVKLPKLISFAKVRGSYAETGGGANWANIYNTYSSAATGPIGTFYPSSTKMPVNLIPERTKSWEAGTELKFLNNRLGIDFTWYKTNTYNQLMKVTTPSSSGYSSGWINAGNIQNKGVEIMIESTPIKTNNFEWNVDLNFTRNVNEVIALTDKLSAYKIDTPNLAEGDNWVIVGRPYGELYTSGFMRNTEGKIIVDALGMPKINTAVDTRGVASTYLGNFNYDWQSGLTNNLSYKNWNMSFLIDLNYGGVRQSATEAMMLECGTSKASLVGREGGIVVDGVLADGVTVNTKAVSAQSYCELVGGRISQNASGEPFNHSATNSRLRELAIGYSIPVKSTLIKALKVSAVGRNLFYIYNGCKWFDPDTTYDNSTNGQGAESAFMPGTRTLGVNIKLTL